MNKERRKKIDAVIEEAEQVRNILQNLQDTIEEIRDDEQEYLENIPENLQGSERYEAAENALNNLEDAVNWFYSADVDELTAALEEAKGE